MIKLGPHSLYELGDTVEWSKLKPSVVKLCWDFSPAPYLPPGIVVIGRPEENFIGAAHPLGQGDPAALGAEFAESIYAPLARAWPRIDVWEASNEVNPDDLFQMQWYARFLAAFAERVHAWGKRAAIGSFATGTPQLELWPAYVPALKACRDYGALHARHCYGPLDIWHAYRYRQDQVIFSGLGYCPQVVITECGEDAPDPPWRRKFGNDIRAYYAGWLKPFILECNKDPYLVGATVFTVGDGHATAWHNFDVSGTGLLEILRADPDIHLEEKTQTMTTTTDLAPNLSVTTTALGEGAQFTAVQAAIYAFHRDLAEKISGRVPAVVLSRPEAGGWVMIFKSITDTAPALRRVTYDMPVLDHRLDAAGVAWYQVYAQPEMWVLADQTRAKPTA